MHQHPFEQHGISRDASRQKHGRGNNQGGTQHAEQHQQDCAGEEEDKWASGGAAAEDALRQSNDKLDMLLHSTVKKSHQCLTGKENRNRQVCCLAVHMCD